MASEILGNNDFNLREKRRWGDGKNVYTRKIHLQKTLTTTATVNENGKTENKNDNITQQCSQTLATQYGNSLQQQHQQTHSCIDAVSDEVMANGRESFNGNGALNGVVVEPLITRVDDDRFRINLGAVARSNNETRELKRKLISDLDQVRSLFQKLEAKEVVLIGDSNSLYFANDVREGSELVRVNSEVGSGNDVRERRELVRMNSEVGSWNDARERRESVRVNSEVGSMRHPNSRPPVQLSVSVMENNHNHGVAGEFVEKQKRTPKANQYYRNSDFLFGKDRLPPESNKKLKSNGEKKQGGGMYLGFGIDKNRTQVFRACGNLLQRLMKHKHGWVFNEPVNAKALGLHDYHDIIKHPMDLGTIKTRLAKNLYKSPREFAEDVRLTFRNAMTYNPKGQDVHIMAEQLSAIFEERWVVIETEYNPDWRYQMYQDAGLPSPFSRKTPPAPSPVPQIRALDRSGSMTVPVDSNMRPSYSAPVGRIPVPKKPKAKDPNKRAMTFEEKQKLSTNLQNLPPEKLGAIVQIINKRNSALSQHDDMIELDIDSVDAETLWELDRFVTNYKKSLSKYKRKAELALKARAGAGHSMPATNPAPAVWEAPKVNKTDERNITSSSPVQGQKQGDNKSRSSSSSSSSSDSGSSSSDSDSASSSAYGSDAGHSPRT